jgi:hypothetical protein
MVEDVNTEMGCKRLIQNCALEDGVSTIFQWALLLVRSHQPRIPRHIGGEDRSETALDGLLHGLPVTLIIAWLPLFIVRNEGQRAAAKASFFRKAGAA